MFYKTPSTYFSETILLNASLFSEPWGIMKLGHLERVQLSDSALGYGFGKTGTSCNRWGLALHVCRLSHRLSFSMGSLHIGQLALPHSMFDSGKQNCSHIRSEFHCECSRQEGIETAFPFMTILRSHSVTSV